MESEKMVIREADAIKKKEKNMAKRACDRCRQRKVAALRRSTFAGSAAPADPFSLCVKKS